MLIVNYSDLQIRIRIRSYGTVWARGRQSNTSYWNTYVIEITYFAECCRCISQLSIEDSDENRRCVRLSRIEDRAWNDGGRNARTITPNKLGIAFKMFGTKNKTEIFRR